jgi:DNA-binding transcriptional MocR family regulator
MITRLSRLKAVIDLSGSLVSQAVATHVLRNAKDLATLRRRQTRACLDHATRLLAQHLPEWTYRRPAGGLSLWLRLPAGDATELGALALRRGVAIVPGTVSSPEGRGSDHVRLPLAIDPVAMEEGMRRIAEAWAEYAPERHPRRRAVGVLV